MPRAERAAARRVQPALARRLLEQRDWAHVTPRTRALGWDFAVRTDDPALGAHLDVLLQEMRAEGEPEHWYSLLVDERPSYVRHRLYRNGKRLLDSPSGARVFLYLLWDINQRLFSHTTDKILLHAAVTEHRGRALVMTAPSEAGKSTLTAALVERGMGYLTDEAAAIDLDTLVIHPYPKPLSIDTGAQPYLAHLRPAAEPSIAGYLTGQWQVAPSWIRPGATSGPVPPAWIIVPRYVRDGDTQLVPMSRADTLAVMMEQELNLYRFGRAGFRTLAELARRCRCFHLITGSLDAACDLVLAMVEEDGDRG